MCTQLHLHNFLENDDCDFINAAKFQITDTPIMGPYRAAEDLHQPKSHLFQFLEFILFSQKILFDLVLEYRYVLEASITTSVIIMW